MNSNIPFNIELLVPDEDLKRIMRPVTSLDTFDMSSKNFHPEGLYSTDTFGVVGTTSRDTLYGYIDLKITILHPIIYNILTKLKSLYKNIMASKEYAIWNNDIKDFEKSNIIDGQTGYDFFVSKISELQIPITNSTSREQSILLLNKYRNNCMIRYVIVIPAGYRDIEVDETGRVSSNEINSMYYKLIAISNTINIKSAEIVPETYNSQRFSLQYTFIEIYEYLNTIIDGKNGLMMKRWTARRVFNSTRNVITSSNTTIDKLGNPNNLSVNDTCLGLYQTMKAMLPITIYNLKSNFLSKVFTSNNTPAILCNKITLKSERVTCSNLEYERWLTNEGLEKQITYYNENTIRHSKIIVDKDYYIGLCYKGHDNTFKLIHGIDELPDDIDKKLCTPITYTELFYISIYRVANKYPLFVTRYPITGVGSVYPSIVKLNTTIDVEARYELGEDWNILGDDYIAKQFPITDSDFFNSIAPHSSKLKGMGGDFDGDTCSATILYSDESIKEIDSFLKDKSCYVNASGELTYDTNTDTIQYVLKTLTGE